MALGPLLSLLAPPLCWSCGAPARSGDPLCRTCRPRLHWLGAGLVELEGVPTWAPVAYEGPATALVRGLKFRGATGLADALAAQMVAAAPPGLLEGAALVPVPIHPGRRRRRGFNQAELLASAIASRAGRPCAVSLERRGRRAPQMGRPRSVRLSALRDAVALSGPQEPPRIALLVDDVITTGATLAACAAVLHAAGSAKVAAVAYARTLGR